MRHKLLILFTAFCGLTRAYDVIDVNGICYGIIESLNIAFVTNPENFGISYVGNVVIPSQIQYKGQTYTVTSISSSSFSGCDELLSVQLPSSVRAVSSCAFLGCTNLRQVSLPATIQTFGSCAFTGCTSLQQLMLPRHTELVDSLTLYCCASLTSVVLPHRIQTVCQGAMEHLPAMEHLYCFASTPPVVEQGAFSLSDQRQCTLHVPTESIEQYRLSPIWSDFYKIVALSDKDYLGQNYQRGDINDDGIVDAKDLELLQRIIVSLPDDAAVRWAADINADGIVNAIDYVSLANDLR